MQLNVIDDNQIQDIHDASLKVLEQTGIWFHGSQEAVDLLKKHGCSAEGFRVRFPPALVDECLRKLPERESLTFGPISLGYREEVSLAKAVNHYVINGNAYYIHDYDAGKMRSWTESDLEDKLLVVDHLAHFKADVCDLFFKSELMGGSPLFRAPSSAQSQIEYVRRWLAGRSGIAHELPILWRNYYEVPGRLWILGHMIRNGVEYVEKRIADAHRYIWINPLSPLQYHPDQTASIIRLGEDRSNFRIVMLCPEVMMGATAPVTMAGALVQHNAEVLAGVVLTQLAAPGMPCMYGCVSAPMDLRNTEVSHGNIETSLFNATAVQLADRYGMPNRICPGNPSAREPGARAAVETALGIAMGAAAGGNVIMPAVMDSTLMLSYEHLLVTDELIGQFMNSHAPMRTDAESLAVSVIEQHGHPSAGYVDSEHTVKNMKRDIYYSEFTGRLSESYEDWYEKAHRKAADILALPKSGEIDSRVRERFAAVASRLRQDSSSWMTAKGDWWKFYVGDIRE